MISCLEEHIGKKLPEASLIRVLGASSLFYFGKKQREKFGMKLQSNSLSIHDLKFE